MTNEEKAREIAHNCCSHIMGGELSDETCLTTEPDCCKASMEMAKWKDETAKPNQITKYQYYSAEETFSAKAKVLWYWSILTEIIDKYPQLCEHTLSDVREYMLNKSAEYEEKMKQELGVSD